MGPRALQTGYCLICFPVETQAVVCKAHEICDWGQQTNLTMPLVEG